MRTELFIADHFDTLASGKTVAMGLFADRVVVLQPDSKVPAPAPELPHALDLDMMVTVLRAPRPGATGRLTITPPGQDMPVVDFALPAITLPTGHSANLIFRLRPLLMPRVGKYKVRVQFGDAVNEHTLEIRRPLPLQTTAPSAEPAPVARRPARKAPAEKPNRH